MALRALGFEPKKQEIKTLIGSLESRELGKEDNEEPENQNTIDFNEFLQIMQIKMVPAFFLNLRAKGKVLKRLMPLMGYLSIRMKMDMLGSPLKVLRELLKLLEKILMMKSLWI